MVYLSKSQKAVLVCSKRVSCLYLYEQAREVDLRSLDFVIKYLRTRQFFFIFTLKSDLIYTSLICGLLGMYTCTPTRWTFIVYFDQLLVAACTWKQVKKPFVAVFRYFFFFQPFFFFFTWKELFWPSSLVAGNGSV